jgi:ADP-ribose pyrophosphatase YjhB (NUDIX family)
VLDPRGGRLLMVQRGTEPGRGLWSVPGGRLETGETARQATAREVREETGLEVEVGRLLGRVDRPGPGRPGSDRVVYQIDDFACMVTGGRLTVGSDAADARWVPVEQVPTLPLVAGLLELLHEWGVLDPPP